MRTLPFLCALLSIPAGCGKSVTPASSAPNVLFVCIDTLRPDHLGCYGWNTRPTSPSLDALASRSTLFRDASAAACWTKPSVPSFLTGTLPVQHGVYQGSASEDGTTTSDVLPQAAWTIAEAFSAAGYQTAAFVKNAQLRKGLGFEQGFVRYVDEAGDAREIRWKASDWLDERDPLRPFFLYLHFLDTHWPYDIPDEASHRWASAAMVAEFRDGKWKTLRDQLNAGERKLSDTELADMLALYDGAIRYVDDELGTLFKKLEREGLAASTLICVLSDHGEDFMEHGRVGHGHGLYETLLRVPWILFVPGQSAREVTVEVSLLDVFPTLLSAAGLTIPAEHRSALLGVDRLREEARNNPILAEHMGKYEYESSIRRSSAKLLQRATSSLPTTAPEVDLRPGARYEFKLAVGDEGATRVTQIEEDDGDRDDDAELKGIARWSAPERLVVAGFVVELAKDVELYGETTGSDGKPRMIEEGVMIKATGRFSATGFVADRVKLYEAEAKVEEELRGTLAAFEAARVQVDEHWLALSEDADLPHTSGRLRMTRDAVFQSLTADPATSQLTVSGESFDLARDPLELAPLAPVESLAGEFARLVKSAAAHRFWGAQDRAVLDAQQVEELQEIGYADGEDD